MGNRVNNVDNFAIFSVKENGLAPDEVAKYIAGLHLEYEKLNKKYEALKAENRKLKKRCEALSELAKA